MAFVSDETQGPVLAVTVIGAKGLKKSSAGLYVKLYLGEEEFKSKPRATDEGDAEWNESFDFSNVQYGSSLRASIRATGALRRSIVGETQVMVDRFFDGKEADETMPLYSDKDQLNQVGELRLKFLMKAAGDTGGAAEEGEGEEDAKASAEEEKFAEAKKAVQVPKAEAISSLKEVAFEGQWKFAVTFHTVDIAGGAAAAMSDYKSSGAAAAARGGKRAAGGGGAQKRRNIEVGKTERVMMELEKKGASYFKGVCPEFHPFGANGNITGSLQKINGKVSLQMQLVNAAGVTTSFNLVGAVATGGVYMGTFSGCEISRQAGSVTGIFKAKRIIASDGDGEDEEEDGAAAAGAGGES